MNVPNNLEFKISETLFFRKDLPAYSNLLSLKCDKERFFLLLFVNYCIDNQLYTQIIYNKAKKIIKYRILSVIFTLRHFTYLHEFEF